MRLVVAVLVVSALSLAGCGGGHACPTYPHRSASKALVYHASMRRYVSSVQAEARVDQRSSEGRIKGTVMMFVKRPDRVRFDVLTQFGPTAILSSNGQAFQFSDLRRKRFLYGATCPSNIARLLGIELSPTELSSLLFGEVPAIRAERSELVCTGDGFYRLTFFAADGSRQEVDLDIREADLDKSILEQRLRLVRAELFDANGKRRWKVIYENYQVLKLPGHEKGVAMAHRVQVLDGKGGDVLLRFKDIDLNVSIEEEVFSQRPAPGLSIKEALCE